MPILKKDGTIATFTVGLGLCLSRGYPAAVVTIPNPPQIIVPGTASTLTIQFSKTPDEPEKRVIARVDLYDLNSQTKIAGAIADNSAAGYTGNSGTINCSVPIPASLTGSAYFKATIAPWSLNKAIVAHFKTYPTDGTFTYLWTGGGYGVTQNIYYLGVLAAPKPTGNTTYCSGLAFDACIVPFNAYNATYGHPYIGNIKTASQMETFRKIWYGVTDSEKLAARAIPDWGVGREITDFEEAQEGDFVQLWRFNASGHNPIFVSWKRNSSNAITGVNYFATQTSTNGIGYSGESFGTSGSRIDRSRFYLGRVAKPRDQADYDWALGAADTKLNPSSIPASISDWARY